MALYINKTFRYPLGSGIAHKCQRFFTTKPPAPKNFPTRWSRQEKDRLTKLLEKDLPVSDIANVLGRSISSIENQKRRLGKFRTRRFVLSNSGYHGLMLILEGLKRDLISWKRSR
ncbi:hypothetical protein K469DRAFT_702365 [Zopfia rhizophila CBS 207.26]|uniref:Uncharacterized protein n=1 Tax=Zopfia rhizophila CBS 207.26 TaxID=1314779 RepID=A0A6A6DAX4_9PEZI|nr:hypothetical protein K469DRAFT_702365 [Zopfia rhizophila CBS 207.26]